MRFKEAKFVGSFPDYNQAPQTGFPEVTFGGRSNVGKSSLINSLLKRKNLAQISKTPGKTRLLNYYVLISETDKEFLFFVDLPGFGYAKVPVAIRKGWKGLVENYVENTKKLRGFVLLIDSRRGPKEEEMQLIEYLLTKERHVCPVLTKADKLTRQEGVEVTRETAKALRPFGENVTMPILHSSTKKQGNDLIWRWIDERIKDANL
jgi:GTP-binding protein